MTIQEYLRRAGLTAYYYQLTTPDNKEEAGRVNYDQP
jgi:hypothetical protein